MAIMKGEEEREEKKKPQTRQTVLTAAKWHYEILYYSIGIHN